MVVSTTDESSAFTGTKNATKKRKSGCIKYKCVRCFVILAAVLLFMAGSVILGIGISLFFVQVQHDNIYDLLIMPAGLMVALGSFILITAVLTLIGSCRRYVPLLWVVFVLLILLVIAEIIVAVLAFVTRQRGEAMLREYLSDGIVQYNDDENSDNSIAFIQKRLECCGIDNYNDWQYNKLYTCDRLRTTDGKACSVPATCCRPEAKPSNGTTCGSELRRSRPFDELNSLIFTHGCYLRLRSWLSSCLDLAGGVVLAFTIFVILCLFLDYWLITHIRRHPQTMYSFQKRVLTY